MILIVDSGATKADWTALNEKGLKEFGTQMKKLKAARLFGRPFKLNP